MIWFRHAEPGSPFLWEVSDQPAARWHAEGDGPAHYLADTSDGAWAEFVRHEEIKDPADLAGVQRAIWAVEVPDEPAQSVELPESTLLGDHTSYAACQTEAKRLRDAGAKRIVVPSAALLPGGAAGQLVRGGLHPAPPRNGTVAVLFGPRPDLVGWAAVHEGRPRADLLTKVRHF
jgi:hypothetical protein